MTLFKRSFKGKVIDLEHYFFPKSGNPALEVQISRIAAFPQCLEPLIPGLEAKLCGFTANVTKCTSRI